MLIGYFCQLTTPCRSRLKGIKCICSLKHGHRGFESHLRHKFLSVILLCLCCIVQVAALRQKGVHCLEDPWEVNNFSICPTVLTIPGFAWNDQGINNKKITAIFWEVVGLERGPLSLVSTTEEPLGRKSGCSGLEIREYGRRGPSRWPRGTLYPHKLALTSPTSGGRSVAIFARGLGPRSLV
jgi:hypothetical protein